MRRFLSRRIATRVFVFVALLFVFAIPNVASSASTIVAPADGYGASDVLLAEWIDSFCLFGDAMAVFTTQGGLEIVDPTNPASRQSWGKPNDYFAAYTDPGSGYVNVWSSFVAADPSNDSLWVGFTMSNNTDDRIYQVDAGGAWTHRATLTGNFDLEFFGEQAYVSANPGAVALPFAAQSTIYRLDVSGADQHDVVAQIGGYSTGLGFSNAGELYYGTYYLDGDASGFGAADNKMIRYSASQVAVGGLTIDDAEVLFPLTSGPCDVDLDDAGNVVFDANGGPDGGLIAVWNQADGRDPRPVALPAGSESSWFALLDVSGNVVSGGGRVYVADYFKAGVAEIVKLIPGDANGDFRVDEADAKILAGHWGNGGSLWAHGDFDGDGRVGSADAAILAANWGWGAQPAEAASTPEPTHAALLAILLLILVGSRYGKK